MNQLDRVLITGGAGFVGSHAAAVYDERGANVTALDDLSRTETLEHADENRDITDYNWQYWQDSHPDVDLVETDIRNADRITEIVEGHDAVVYTAG